MSTTSPIPTAPLLARLIGAGVLGTGLGLVVAFAMGARGDSLIACGGVLLAVAVIGCVPAFLAPVFSAATFGLVAIVASMMQTLAGAGLIIGAASMEGVARKPVAVGGSAGCFTMLLLCALVTVAAISKLPASAFKPPTKPDPSGAT